MFKFLGKLFRKTPAALPGSIPEESWQADFSSLAASRFEPSSDPRYEVSASEGSLALSLSREGLFAWTEAAVYRYGDCSVEAILGFPADSRGAAGLVVRASDATSFAYLLVSPADGTVLMDVVFNGSPRALVPRLECPWIRGKRRVELTLVARGRRYLALLDGRWAFEVEDDTLETGRLGFAARVGNAAPDETFPAVFSLDGLGVESRPVEVEVDYLRFARVLEADREQRRRLARAYFEAGDWLPALVHLKKLADAATAEDLFLRAECCVRLDLLDEAESALDACLALEPSHDRAIEERYNLLYLRGRYLELRDALEADRARAAGSSRLMNLLGHACYNLGAWEPAARAYGEAARMEPDMPIYALNHARALEQAGERAEAAAAWLDAAAGFFAQEAWDDAHACSTRLRELRYDEAALDSLDARIALARGDGETAERLLSRLSRRKQDDAPAAYAWGLMLAAKNRRPEALASFRRAAELEPSDARYLSKLAEAVFLSGGDCGEELRRALEADPSNGWTLNLAGQEAASRGEREAALAWFRKAAAALPGRPEPAINLSDALSSLGRHDEAVAVLKPFPRSAPAANQRGNAEAAAGRLREAVAAYREAVACAAPADPSLPDYLTNLGAALIERDEWPEAESALRKALEARQDARSLTLMGDVADYFGEYPRAEAAYRLALDLEPQNAGALRRLARHYLARGRYADAGSWAGRLLPLDPDAAEAVLAAVRDATEQGLSCGSCGRAWTLPKPTPATPRVALRGEPPDDCPAGSCPSCGKTFCVACRKERLADGRFTCPDCGVNLSLNDDRVRWLVREAVKER